MTTGQGGYRFVRFGLLVTGKGEQDFIASLFNRYLARDGCRFEVIRKVAQRSPRTSPKKPIEVLGSGKRIPTRDEEEIGLPARQFLVTHEDSFVILLDDLEYDRSAQHAQVYERYRGAFDQILRRDDLWRRTSVHFLVMMLEAYYFADARAVNGVLGTSLIDHDGDVESIRHPKNELKKHAPGYREREHGKQIIEALDLEHVLDDPATCASLRTLLAWCTRAFGNAASERFQLASGALHPVTSPELDYLD